ncbi:hypothetical protein M0802_015949 [Mischocyttarus mexicanus]|nr:hypothetical protein M0802_015949 [Mischocyttarus mexicanus]
MKQKIENKGRKTLRARNPQRCKDEKKENGDGMGKGW